MPTMTKEQFDKLVELTDAFNEPRGYNEVHYGDVVYTYFNPKFILNDWDEGENNDPRWDKKTNTHSVIKFIKDTCELLRSLPH